MSLLRRLAKPGHGFLVVLQNALAPVVHAAQVVLGARVTLLRRLAIPGHGFLVVLGYAPAVGVHDAQVVLGFGVSLLSQGTPYCQRGCEVPAVGGIETPGKVLFIPRHSRQWKDQAERKGKSCKQSH